MPRDGQNMRRRREQRRRNPMAAAAAADAADTVDVADDSAASVASTQAALRHGMNRARHYARSWIRRRNAGRFGGHLSPEEAAEHFAGRLRMPFDDVYQVFLNAHDANRARAPAAARENAPSPVLISPNATAVMPAAETKSMAPRARAPRNLAQMVRQRRQGIPLTQEQLADIDRAEVQRILGLRDDGNSTYHHDSEAPYWYPDLRPAVGLDLTETALPTDSWVTSGMGR